MKCIYWKLQKLLFILLIVFILTSFLLTGCEDNPLFSDPNLDNLKNWSQKSWLTTDAKERFNLAISKYKNGILDPEPVLLLAFLSKPIGIEEVSLGVVILDEDKDLLGFVIKEELQDTNGAKTVLEEYPVFAHHPGILGANRYSFPISIRKNGQRKDDKLWTEYLAMDFDTQVKQIKVTKSGDWLTEESEYWGKLYKLWKDSLPPIYISIPDSNELNVWIRIYDEAGNRSNSIRLIDRTKR